MTFEEVKNRIKAGTAPETLEDIASDISVLTEGASDVEHLIAIRLYESLCIRGKKGWCSWAMETFGHYDDAATVSRRCEVGRMLRLLRDNEPCLFRKHLSTPITFLERLLPILHDETRGFPALVNFLRLYWKDDWSRDKMIEERDRFLYPSGRKNGKPVQLTFDFNGLQAQEEEDIAAFIEEKRLPPEHAGMLVRNGVMLCTAALPYMTAHPESFDDEDIPYLEDMRDRLETAARNLAGLIANRNRKVLAV